MRVRTGTHMDTHCYFLGVVVASSNSELVFGGGWLVFVVKEPRFLMVACLGLFWLFRKISCLPRVNLDKGQGP